MAEKQSEVSAAESPNELSEELARDPQQQLALRRSQIGKELANADRALPADSPQPSDEAIAPKAGAALDEDKSASTGPAAANFRRLATPPTRKSDTLDAAPDDGTTQESSGAARYKFKPLVRHYADWDLTQSQRDQTETVYWNPLVIADEGVPVPIRFRLSDAETSYRLLINGHGGGRLGSYRQTITTALDDAPDATVDVEAED